MAKKQYYDITNLLNTKAQYMMLLGQRANGKSYQVKKTMLENAYRNHKWFIYLRRYKADIKTKAVENYFNDMPIAKITDNEYSGIIAWNGAIYFSCENDKGETVKIAQAILELKGYDLSPYNADGDFGNLTESRVKEYQTKADINVTGIIDEQTWISLIGG